MSLVDELTRLEALRERGALSDEEFARAKSRLIDSPPSPSSSSPAPGTPVGVAAVNSYRRSLSDKWLGGVCGGLAGITGLDSWVWRLGFTLLALFAGTGVILYILLWVFVPAE